MSLIRDVLRGVPQKNAVLTSPVCSALSYAILIGGLLTIAVSVHMVVVSYCALPFWDGWTQIDVVANGQNPLSLSWLWTQHNEHRLVVPKLFLAADLLLFRARQVFLLTGILVIQILLLLLLAWSMRRFAGWHGPLWRTGVGLAAFCLFCPSQWENFVWGFQVCFMLPAFFAVLSFVALVRYWDYSQPSAIQQAIRPFLALSVIAALAASYSLANGSVLWPLLALAALFLRLRAVAVLSFAVMGLLSTVLYFRGYVRPSSHADPLASLKMPLAFLKYVMAYFGSSWTNHNVGAAEAIGLIGLVVALVLTSRTASYARDGRPFTVELVLIIAFCLATACVTAAGRLNFGADQASSSRYQSIALLFWCCLGLLLFNWLPHSRFAHRGVLIAQICLLAVLVRGALIAHRPLAEARQHGFMLNVAASSLLTGVHDESQLALAYPQVDVVLRDAAYMKAHHLSIFSGGLSSLLGITLPFAQTSPDDCAGKLETVMPVADSGIPGVRITGWAWDRKHNEPPARILAAADGRVTGLAAMGERRPTVRAANPWMKSRYVGFAGYVREAQPSTSPVKLYAILRGSPPSACYLATQR